MKSEERLNALERRRIRAARLLQRGVRRADVARRVALSRQPVSRWAETLANEQFDVLRRPAGPGANRR